MPVNPETTKVPLGEWLLIKAIYRLRALMRFLPTWALLIVSRKIRETEMASDSPTTRDDYTNRPAYLRQIADEMDEGRDSPCSEASVCREAAAEIEQLRSKPTNPNWPFGGGETL